MHAQMRSSPKKLRQCITHAARFKVLRLLSGLPRQGKAAGRIVRFGPMDTWPSPSSTSGAVGIASAFIERLPERSLSGQPRALTRRLRIDKNDPLQTWRTLMRGKLKQAGWNDDYLAKLLAGLAGVAVQ